METIAQLAQQYHAIRLRHASLRGDYSPQTTAQYATEGVASTYKTVTNPEHLIALWREEIEDAQAALAELESERTYDNGNSKTKAE